ncbi:hypothetical protein Tco_0535945 [Tanacetum coccineum]
MVETLKKMINSNFQGIDVVDEATAKMKLEITSKPIASDEIDHLVLQLQMEGFGRAHCKARQAVGKQLEDYGVLSDSLRSRNNSLGLHMPLVCPDGAVVAYNVRIRSIVIPLHPIGSLDPDAIVFFQPTKALKPVTNYPNGSLKTRHVSSNLDPLHFAFTKSAIGIAHSALVKFENKAADGGITALHMATLNGYADCV